MSCCGSKRINPFQPEQKRVGILDIVDQLGGGSCCQTKAQWPSQELCTLLKEPIKELLAVAGAKGAYISDVSLMSDFEGLWGVTEETAAAEAEKICETKCQEISEKLGLGLDGVKPTDYIVEVAQKIKSRS